MLMSIVPVVAVTSDLSTAFGLPLCFRYSCYVTDLHVRILNIRDITQDPSDLVRGINKLYAEAKSPESTWLAHVCRLYNLI